MKVLQRLTVFLMLLPSLAVSYEFKTVMESNSVVVRPANFWSANSNAIWQLLSGQLTSQIGTNSLVVTSNSLQSQLNNVGTNKASTTQLTLTSNTLYSALSSNVTSLGNAIAANALGAANALVTSSNALRWTFDSRQFASSNHLVRLLPVMGTNLGLAPLTGISFVTNANGSVGVFATGEASPAPQDGLNITNIDASHVSYGILPLSVLPVEVVLQAGLDAALAALSASWTNQLQAKALELTNHVGSVSNNLVAFVSGVTNLLGSGPVYSVYSSNIVWTPTLITNPVTFTSSVTVSNGEPTSVIGTNFVALGTSNLVAGTLYVSNGLVVTGPLVVSNAEPVSVLATNFFAAGPSNVVNGSLYVSNSLTVLGPLVVANAEPVSLLSTNFYAAGPSNVVAGTLYVSNGIPGYATLADLAGATNGVRPGPIYSSNIVWTPTQITNAVTFTGPVTVSNAEPASVIQTNLVALGNSNVMSGTLYLSNGLVVTGPLTIANNEPASLLATNFFAAGPSNVVNGSLYVSNGLTVLGPLVVANNEPVSLLSTNFFAAGPSNVINGTLYVSNGIAGYATLADLSAATNGLSAGAPSLGGVITNDVVFAGPSNVVNGSLYITNDLVVGGKLTQSRTILLCAAYTPSATGADAGEIPVPYSLDGTTSLTWSLKRITLRVQSAGGAPAVTVEKSTGTGAFSATSVGSVTLGTGAYEASATTGLGTLASGDKVRFNPTVLGTAKNWTLVLEITSQ